MACGLLVFLVLLDLQAPLALLVLLVQQAPLQQFPDPPALLAHKVLKETQAQLALPAHKVSKALLDPLDPPEAPDLLGQLQLFPDPPDLRDPLAHQALTARPDLQDPLAPQV